MSFDSLAPHYRWMEAVLAGGKLQRCRCAHLEKIPNHEIRNMLLTGEGPGRFLEVALQHFPAAQFHVVDGSERMLERAHQIAESAIIAPQSRASRRNFASLTAIPPSPRPSPGGRGGKEVRSVAPRGSLVRNPKDGSGNFRLLAVDEFSHSHRERPGVRAITQNARVSFESVDLLKWIPPANTFDLIGTFFTLDCFRPDQLALLIPRFITALRPNGHWLISDFAVPSRGWRRWRARLIHALMYACFRRITKLPAQRWTDPDDLLLQSGMTLIARETTDWGLLRADCWRRV